MSARNEDFLFAQEAQNLGYVNEEQVEEGFLLQRRMTNDLQIDERLAVILVKRGWLAEEQARRVYGIIEPEGAHTEIEGYRLVQKIGRGAMGTVYKAIHKNLHRVVAIKILRRDLAADKTQIERLKREAKLLADLDHPNIVRAFDAGESNGFPFLVMEYVEGETLRDRIAREGALSNEEALRITRALADALEKARRMGIVHRDVKPGNILLSKSGTPKLMDLGLAKGPVDLGLTQHGATVGTPQFMSPEQAESPDKADTRSDIYSLGATLYAMVTTRPPFEGSTLAEIITKVMSRQPVPPRVRNEDVSPEVSHLIERMMLKDATLRYATPAQVVTDIDMIRGGQSIIPHGFQGNWEAYLLRKRWQQRKHWVIGIAAAVLVLAVGLFWMFRQIDHRTNQKTADDLAELVLRVPRPDNQVLLATLEQHAEQARSEFEELDDLERRTGVSAARRDEAEARAEEIEEALDRLRVYTTARKGWESQMAKGRYKDVRLRVDMLEPRVRDVEPAHTKWMRFKEKLPRESDAAWKRAQALVLGRPAGDLASFEALWRDWSAALGGDFIETEALQEARARATPVALAASRIAAEVAAAQKAFAPAALAERVENFDFRNLKGDLFDRSAAVRQKVEADLRIFGFNGAPYEKRSLLGDDGLVTGALQRLEKDLDRQVEALWDRIRAGVETLDPPHAVERLNKFAAAAGRGESYPSLSREAEALKDEIEREYLRQKREAMQVYDATMERVLRILSKGEANRLGAEIDDALENRVLTAEKTAVLEALRVAVPALAELRQAALAFLEKVRASGRRLLDVPVRASDETWLVHKRWSLQAVDAKSGTIQVRRPMKGSRSTVVEIHIGQVRLDRVRDWAVESGRPIPPLAGPLVDLAVLAPVHDDPGQDLRKRLGAYRAVLARFEKLDPQGAWTAVTRRLVADLGRIQRQREKHADTAATSINILFNKPGGVPEYKRVLELWERISDSEGRLRYTAAYESQRKDLAKTAKACRDVIDQQELLQLFHGGVDIEERPGDRQRITFDFDDAPQMDNFTRCFGELVPTGGPITPVARGYRLMLLKGVQGLLFDRPLALYNMFDTGQKISVEFTIDTRDRRGASILAIDIDGVQIAVSSLDPNYWRWRFPRDIPLVEGEAAPPQFDFYGRGRGVAFHEGREFGRSFPLGNWTWDKLSDAADFEKWKDRSYIKKHRAKLFAFAPGQTYRVRIERERDTMRLIVDDELIVQKKMASWGYRGKHATGFRNGSGMIQILTLTPLAIDNLVFEGHVTDRWRAQRKREIKARDAAREKAGEREGK